MTVTASAVLDANLINDTGAEITMTVETLVSLYVHDTVGSHNNHRVTMEFTANGVNWFPSPHSLNGVGGVMTEEVVATKARAKVIGVEGSASTVDVILIAR